MRRVVLAVVLALTLTACLPEPPPDAVGFDKPYTKAFQTYNNYRTYFGHSAVWYDDQNLEAMAQAWAQFQCDNRVTYHRDLSTVINGGWWNSLGEMIVWAWGQDTYSVDQAVHAWWNSLPHRAILLGDYSAVGFGAAKCAHGIVIVANTGRY